METEEKTITRDRLLDAACKLFAEKGFRNTTVAEICEAAEANIASINYYFGDKEKLYDEVWRHAFNLTRATFPIGESDEEVDTETALFGYSSAILHRIFCEGKAGLFPRLLSQEMAAPTLALEKIANEALAPQTRIVEKTVRKMLGSACDEHTIWLCKHSIIGQCAFYNCSRPLRAKMIGCSTMSEEAINQIAWHIARFSAGGLQAIKQKGTTHE